ncbi:hypothetical protein GLOIN_2v1562163 [Rhizophagus irregularis DAOM 181602=DAOM 197198]|nr:hypothetical protein GLOIN_2v1562163 [Rhizophagus irregularis DAOM 181602=DAOM 197198]
MKVFEIKSRVNYINLKYLYAYVCPRITISYAITAVEISFVFTKVIENIKMHLGKEKKRGK